MIYLPIALLTLLCDRSKQPLPNSASHLHFRILPGYRLTPPSYCVRPNSGRIEPGKHVDVQGWCFRELPLHLLVRRLTFPIVLLQAMKEEPAPDAKCKDKFLVQSVLVSPDLEYANVTSIVWLPIHLNPSV